MALVGARSVALVIAFLGTAIFGAVIGSAASSGKTESLGDYIASICAARFHDASPMEAQFLADNVSAMSKMMVEMGINPSGDVDRDFVAMMVPHHRGAIEMAQAELRYGGNERLRRMAQEIIVTQHQEIAAMGFAVGEILPLPSSDRQTSHVGDVKSGPR